MNAYEDALTAIDALVEWLRANPHRDDSNLEGRYMAVRPTGEYNFELRRRSDRVVNRFNHLMEDGLVIPNEYSWRRFREVLESGCRFDAGDIFHPVRHEQDEILRVVETARQNLMDMSAPKSESRPKPQKVGPPPQQESAEASVLGPRLKLKKRENVGYGWPVKLVFATAAATATFALLPRYIPHTESFAKDRITLTIAVFGAALVVANLIRKP